MARNQFDAFFNRSEIEIVPVTQELTVIARRAFYCSKGMISPIPTSSRR